MNSPYENAKQQLKAVQKILKCDPNIITRLLSPDRVIEVSVPVKMDDGKTRVFAGYRSQHNNARGPYKGGIRFHPGVTREEVMALSMWMTWKTALLDLPLGGGKGGVIVDTKDLSDGETEQLSRRFLRSIAPYIGTDVDVPAPDVSTDPRIMAWMLDEYERIVGANRPGVITGKPIGLGGSEVREYATAQGAFLVIEEAREKFHLPQDATVAIQGLGNSGSHLARLLSQAGYRIVAVADSKATLYREEGLEMEAILTHKRTTGSLMKCVGCQQLGSDDVLHMPADILVPAALENAIRPDNAAEVKAKLIVEVANGPVTPEAEEILISKGITVIPDILANAGGVTVSYFEQVQNAMNYYWTEKEILGRLEEKMRNAFTAAWEEKERYNISFRLGAYMVAVKRVAQAMQARGRV